MERVIPRTAQRYRTWPKVVYEKKRDGDYVVQMGVLSASAIDNVRVKN